MDNTTMQIAEVVELSLEKTIETKLVQSNVTLEVLAALKAKYGGMKLKTLDDKESYLEIKAAAKECAKVRTLTVKLCKEGRERAVKEQKLWIAKEKEIVGHVAEVEDVLDAEIAKFDAETTRLANEEKNRQEEAYINRQATLTKMGATYTDGSFVLGESSFEANLIKGSSQDVWEEAIVPKFQAEYEKIEAVRIEADKKRVEQENKIKEDAEKLKKEQEDLRKKQEDFDRQKKEADDQEKINIAMAENVRIAAQEKVFAARLSLLKGWSFNGLTVSSHGDIWGNKSELYSLPEELFQQLIKDNNIFIEEQAQKAEDKRLVDIETAKQDAIKKEQERQAEKTRQDAIKKQQEEEKKQAELEAANDKTKWEEFIKQIQNIKLFDMRSGQYRKKMSIAKERLEEIIAL